MAGNGHRAAGGFEIWAARAWNVFNEGRPFSIVFPVLVLLSLFFEKVYRYGPEGRGGIQFLLGAGEAGFFEHLHGVVHVHRVAIARIGVGGQRDRHRDG